MRAPGWGDAVRAVAAPSPDCDGARRRPGAPAAGRSDPAVQRGPCGRAGRRLTRMIGSVLRTRSKKSLVCETVSEVSQNSGRERAVGGFCDSRVLGLLSPPLTTWSIRAMIDVLNPTRRRRVFWCPAPEGTTAMPLFNAFATAVAYKQPAPVSAELLGGPYASLSGAVLAWAFRAGGAPRCGLRRWRSHPSSDGERRHRVARRGGDPALGRRSHAGLTHGRAAPTLRAGARRCNDDGHSPGHSHDPANRRRDL
jgi:hypothetical protein